MTVPSDNPLRPALEVVASFDAPMPSGVTVSGTGRLFLAQPRWGEDTPATVVELRGSERVPYPSPAWNTPASDTDADAFVSVQAVVVDALDRLWAMDTGAPKFQPTASGGPKLVGIDLATNQVVQTILIPADVALPTSYLNDVRVSLRHGAAGTAFSTDSSATGPNGIVVVDLATGESWRRLHDHPSTKALPEQEFRAIVEGQPLPKFTIGSDGIALSADGQRLYYSPLISRRLWSVSVAALVDRALSDEEVAQTVVDEGDKGSGSDGLEADNAGNLYLTSYEHNAVLRKTPAGQFETVACDARLLWPDALCVSADGYLYVTANQVHRHPLFNDDHDRRLTPHTWLFRVAVGTGPVLLR